MNDIDKTNKTILNIDENLEAALCYVLLFFTGLLLFLLEKDNRFVRFHAAQSIVTFLPLFVLGWLISVIAALSYTYWLFATIGSMLWLIEALLWIILIVKAYQHEMFKLPIVGNFAEELANR